MIARFLVAVALIFPLTAHAADTALFIGVIECESGGNPDAVGDHGLARGLAQFHRDTFYEMAAQAKMKGMQWQNSIHQMKLLNWALSHGKGSAWTCYSKITRTGPFRLKVMK